MRAFRSIMFTGSKPYSARNASGVTSRVVVWPMRVDTSFTVVLPSTSWRASLSPVTITVSPPCPAFTRAMVPSRSSASQPSSSYRRMFMASSTSFSTGICTASSSGIPLRWALYSAKALCRKVGARISKATASPSGFSSSSSLRSMLRKPKMALVGRPSRVDRFWLTP